MFESTVSFPPDAIFGLAEDFKKDPNPDKINLTVGMYQDESGRTPVMDCVHRAEEILFHSGASHVYLPIDGIRTYNDAIPRLVLGQDHQAVSNGRALAAQTPGGTAALRVSAELLKRYHNVSRIWITSPTWANHLQIFREAGLTILPIEYLDGSGTGINFDAYMQSFRQTRPGDSILLHTVCHNPTGIDPTPGQWDSILSEIRDRGLFPIFDFAYQGFGEGVEEDAGPVRSFCNGDTEALICSSFSKNFNLYGERVGALSVVAKNAGDARAVMSQIKATIRTMYSNPPMHGAAIVDTVFRDQTLNSLWLKELDAIRNRIRGLREMFVTEIGKRLPDASFGHILKQRGMFSYSGLSGDAAIQLRKDHSIYLLESGRINIAGINAHNVDRLCDAIARVKVAAQTT